MVKKYWLHKTHLTCTGLSHRTHKQTASWFIVFLYVKIFIWWTNSNHSSSNTCTGSETQCSYTTNKHNKTRIKFKLCVKSIINNWKGVDTKNKRQLFKLRPSLSTVGRAGPCSCCKSGFCIRNLRRKQWRSGRAVQRTASFHPEHAHRWSQHSLSLAFFFPKPAARQLTLPSEIWTNYSHTQINNSDRWHKTSQIQIPLWRFSAWVDMACCLRSSPWLTV